MKTTRIARKLGLDGNPLRRRTDKIAARFAALLLAVFLIGAPFLSVAAAGWASRAGAGGQQAERSWHQVSAVLLRGAPAPSATGGVLRSYQVLARWWAPDGRARTGRIPVKSQAWPLAARSGCGWPVRARRRFPLSHRLVLAHDATAAVIAAVAVGIVPLCLAWAGRWVRDRRRLADWEAAWAAAAPRWTKRFLG